MPVYQYYAKSPDGKDVTGQQDATSIGALVSELKRSGLTVINVEEAGSKSAKKKQKRVKQQKQPKQPKVPDLMSPATSGGAGIKKASKRKPVKTRDLAILCRQLSTMLKAGLPILDAFETLASEAENLTMQEAMLKIKDAIEAGSSLSEAINEHPKIFPLMFRAMIEAGEASGSLTKIVAQLGEYLKRRDALQKKIKSAMVYPKFVLIFFFLLVAGILAFLVPQFEDTFASLSKPCPRCMDPGKVKGEILRRQAAGLKPKEVKRDLPPGSGFLYANAAGATVRFAPSDASGNPIPPDPATGWRLKQCPACKGDGVTAKLPAMTQVLLSLSRLLVEKILWVIGAIVVVVVVWKKYSGSATGRAQLDRLSLRLPIAGPLVLKSSVARFCMTLSTLLHNGVSLDQSLDIVSRVAGNVVLEEATQQIREMIVQGHGLAASMQVFPVFPNMVNRMVSVGEESGALAEMLTDISDYYEEEVNAAVEGISSVIEPLMIVMIGAIVCIVVLALYMPIFNMGKAVAASN
jgi:type II secretory pathway component PulF